MSTCSTVVAPIGVRGFAVKARTLAAGAVVAGTALLGGTAVAPTITAGLTASVQHEVTLTAFPTFTESLQSLLNAVDFGNMGQVLGVFGDGVSTTSSLATVLAALNPNGMTLDTATWGILSTDLTALLNDVELGGHPLGSIPIDSLVGGLIGGDGADTEVGTLLGYFGLGPYAGLLDLPMFDLSPTDKVGDLLNSMLGIDATTSINDMLNADGMTDATVASLLGITPTQLSAGWDQFVDNMVVGGTLASPDGSGVLGDETLGTLLTALLGTGDDPVTDDTTLTSVLSDLGLFTMLGLS